VGTRITNNLFIVSSDRIIASDSDCPHTCGRMDKTILSAKAVGYERDMNSGTGPYPSEYMTTRVGWLDEDPDLVIMRIDKIVGASSRGRRVAQASNDSREYLQATPYLDAPTRHEVYSMSVTETSLQTDRKVTTGCVMYTYFVPVIEGPRSIKFARQDVKHIGSEQLQNPYEWSTTDFGNRFVHLFTFNQTEPNIFRNVNEGSPIFCQEKLSFITSLRTLNGTLRAISIADNIANIEKAEVTFPNKIEFPKPPPE